MLRRVDGSDLLAHAGAGLGRAKKAPSKAKLLDESAVADVFGIEMAEVAPPVRARRQGANKKVPPQPAVATRGKPAARSAPVVKKKTAKRSGGA